MNIEFSYISDLHIDFYVPSYRSKRKQEKGIDRLVDSLIPDKLTDILLIAGDLSHYNYQTIYLLKSLKRYYKHILFTTGNHDLYLVSKNQYKKYNGYSFNRLDELKTYVKDIDGVVYLDGQIIDINGIKFSGCPMWYDGSYSKYKFNMTNELIAISWKNGMNDSRLIHGILTHDELFKKQIKKFRDSVCLSDVYISHVGPVVPKNIPSCYNNHMTGFFYFDGEKYLYNDSPNIYLFGHTHNVYDFMYNNTRMICNPYGYPHEKSVAKIKVLDNKL